MRMTYDIEKVVKAGQHDDVRPGTPPADPDAAQGRDVLPAVVGHHRGLGACHDAGTR